MPRRLISTFVLIAMAALVARAEAQVQDSPALRAAIAQAGGRAIVTLKSSNQRVQIVSPGTPPVSGQEMAAIENRMVTTYPVQVFGRAPFMAALFTVVGDSGLTRLLADPNVAAIEPDQKSRLTAAEYHSAERVARVRADAIPWGVSDVGAPAAWASGLTGAGVKVGIMDTGIDWTHPDLHVTGGYDFTTSSSAPAAYMDNVASCNGHGTHVSGTVAALQNGSQIVGVAPNAVLYALKVFEDDGAGCFAWLSSQLNALNWAVTNHLDVVSISIGNTETAAYDNAVITATGAGVVVVAASGNNSGGPVVSPANAPGAIAVAALNSDNSVASYSNSGPEMWIAAPGTNVESTMPGGGTALKSGTSMATPHVTGVVALLRQAHPTWTVDQVRNAIQSSAIDINMPGFDNSTGWGLVQAPSTQAPPPLTLAVSPVARGVSVVQGQTAPGDQASVTLSGTNASSTAWSASKKKAWTTLTTTSGTGSGTVTWTRNTTGLVVGTYVDTISISATGAAGSPGLVFDTLKITAAGQPLTIAVSPNARSVSVQQGLSAPGDNATVTLTGTNAGSTAWSATHKQPWTIFATGNGTGSGTVAWGRQASGLAVGTYVDTITVSAAGATGSPAFVYDTMKITAAPLPLTIAVSPNARSVSVQQGLSAPGDNATVTLTGTNAGSTAWSATHKQPWTIFSTSSGTGSGTVAWGRQASGLAAGTYVDTITVSAAGATGSPAFVYDTMKITAAPLPLTIAVSPNARSVSVQQGLSAPGDNATVTLTGTNAGSTAWSATHKQPWTIFATGNGTGSGTVAWGRQTSGLTAGTYVDTITVSAAGATGSPAFVYDTMKITAAPLPLTIAVSPNARSVSVQQGLSAPGDNATVTLTGTNAGSTAWSATHKQPWTIFSTSNGTGSGTVTWGRQASGLAAGTYVDTITVSAAGATGSPAFVYDTMKITAAPLPLTIAVSPNARSVSVQQGGSAPADNATVTLTGTNAGSTAWSAAKKQPWLTLTTANGTGSGVVSWTRSTAGLAAGTYVDTITVSAAGATGSPATVFDTLKISTVPVPVVLAVSPASRAVSVQQGGTAPGDNGTVTLTGTNAGSTAWSATHKQPWTVFSTGNGTGSGTVSWNRNASGLGAGTYVDTITVSAAGATGSPGTIYDTLRITAAPAPLTIAASPTSRELQVIQGGSAPGDSANIMLAGANAGSTSWSATRTSSWASLTRSTGTGSGSVKWTRNSSGLAVGTYVDTLKISVTGVSGLATTIYDTLLVAAQTIAVHPGSKRGKILKSNGASFVTVSVVDSALVDGTIGDSSFGLWTATTDSPRLQMITSNGALNTSMAWQRLPADLAPGVYVDTIHVALQTDSTVRVEFLDSLEVVAVNLPEPDVAVSDLFGGNTLTEDQRSVLDRAGNNNGRFDLGDLLAWLDHAHIRLTGALAARVQSLVAQGSKGMKK